MNDLVPSASSVQVPEYEGCIEPILHCRCTVCGGWWQIEWATGSKGYCSYWCPYCGQKLQPAQYPETTKTTKTCTERSTERSRRSLAEGIHPEIPTGSVEL